MFSLRSDILKRTMENHERGGEEWGWYYRQQQCETKASGKWRQGDFTARARHLNSCRDSKDLKDWGKVKQLGQNGIKDFLGRTEEEHGDFRNSRGGGAPVMWLGTGRWLWIQNYFSMLIIFVSAYPGNSIRPLLTEQKAFRITKEKRQQLKSKESKKLFLKPKILLKDQMFSQLSTFLESCTRQYQEGMLHWRAHSSTYWVANGLAG